MPAIPLGLTAYKRADLPPIMLKNMSYEKTPANLEDQTVLIPRPRLKQFAIVGPSLNTDPIRGAYRKGGVIAGRIIVLAGTNLYRIEQAGVPGVGTATLIGTVPGTARMSAEGNVSYVVLACGGVPYRTDGTTLQVITMPDSVTVNAIDTLNQYFLFSINASGVFYWSDLGTTTVSALNFATAESQPDVLITLKVIGDELWLFGRVSIEVWQPTGDADLPFQRIGGRIFGIGATARDTVQKLNVAGRDVVCWVGTDRIVYQTNPNPTRISDHSLEEKLRRVADPASLYAETYSWNGHDYYILNLPGEGSWAYDLSTGTWDQMTSYSAVPSTDYLFRGNCSTVGPNSQPLIGDSRSNRLYEFTSTERTDDGDPVVFEWSGLVEINDNPQPCNNVLLDMSVGLNPDPEADPMVAMKFSDDRGSTYSDRELEPLGRQGERETRVMWSGTPRMERPGRVFVWDTTEPVTVRKAKFGASFR